ncbi:hypothetical protein [Arsenicibacter rosenii]|nr:hypothetical protein [Arsenicibacter rosenii]
MRSQKGGIVFQRFEPVPVRTVRQMQAVFAVAFEVGKDIIGIVFLPEGIA